MNLKKLLSLVVIIGLLGGLGIKPAQAAWTDYRTVTSIYSGYSNGRIYVQGLENVGNCSNGLIVFDPAYTDPAKILSSATTSMLTGKRMACNVSGCAGSYQSGRQCRLIHN